MRQEEIALDLSLRELQLIVGGIAQVRSTGIAVSGVFLSLNILLFNNSLARNITGGDLTLGLAGTGFAVMVAFFLLLPVKNVAWPNGASLLRQSPGTATDHIRSLVFELEPKLMFARKSLDLFYWKVVVAILVGAVSVGLWAYLVTQLPAPVVS